MLFIAAIRKSIFAYLWLFVFLQLDSGEAQDVSRKFLHKKGAPPANLKSPSWMRTSNRFRIMKFMDSRRLERGSAVQGYCPAPPQLENGVRRRHKVHCGDYVNGCDIAEDVKLAPGTLLNYTCDPGYKLHGNPIVSCTRNGIWSTLPVCIDAKCDPLDSLTTGAKCFRQGRWVSCDSTMHPGTRAKLSCRSGYARPMTLSTSQSDTVECSMAGKWEPDPIECVPVCGVAISGSTSDFPWHASIYKRFAANGIKYFKCGATVVHASLVLTAASCVYEDKTKMPTNAGNLFIMAGNTFQDYDHPLHDPRTVWKSAVKAVHINCDYHGPKGDSPSDIALVEIQRPFEFSRTLTPACLDHSEYGEEMLQPGSYGSIAEFGATTIGGMAMANDVVSIKSVPYVPYDECRTSGKISVRETLSTDKFCAGYPNRSVVCVQNEGGGLAFEKNDLWYVMGIVTEIPTVGSANSECMNYAIYTDVSQHTAWIQDVIFNLERYETHPPCNREWSRMRTTILTRTLGATEDSMEYRTAPIVEDYLCRAPPQPENGAWRIHGNLCKSNTDCEVPEGAEMKPGTQLIYTCFSGYGAIGRTDVYCGSNGNWSMIPFCMKIECDPLKSASTLATCQDPFDKRVSCDSPVPPGTRADVYCYPGYRMDSAYGTSRRKRVTCNENGKWTPDPILCVPVCGVTVTHQTPFAIGATPAKIGDFPWHATLYKMKKSSRGIKMEFICGASIIQSKFLLTAAHCVYDEETRATEDANKFFVMTGNVFRDYDFPGHDPEVVKKRAVKYVYTPCKYYGLRGHYGSDIALLELDEPFTLSGILLPTCLDVEGYTKQILEPGASGRVAGFGRTATGSSSGILQTLSLPYVSFGQCKNLSTPNDNDVLIGADKFCAGYTNGSAVCEGDSGGGLVFKKGGLWYILGIVSVGLGVDFTNGERTCHRYSYSVHTKVSEHMLWILDVMYQRAQDKSYPSCENFE